MTFESKESNLDLIAECLGKVVILLTDQHKQTNIHWQLQTQDKAFT